VTLHYPQKSALTSAMSGGRSVGTVLLLTKSTEFVLFFVLALYSQNFVSSNSYLIVSLVYTHEASGPNILLSVFQKLINLFPVCTCSLFSHTLSSLWRRIVG
jgi:hypothetical protein